MGKHFVCASAGDFRMVIGEDKLKVANIVKDNVQHFRILYSNILRDCPQVVYKPQQGKLEVKLQHKQMHQTHMPTFMYHWRTLWSVYRL